MWKQSSKKAFRILKTLSFHILKNILDNCMT